MASGLSTREVQAEAQSTPAFQHQMGQISRQSSIFFAGTLFTTGAGYLFKIYLARALGAEALGIYAMGMTMAGFIGVFNALGLPQSAVRFVAAYCATGKMALLRGFLGRSLVILLTCNLALGAVLVLLGPWIAVHFYHTPALKPYLGLFALIMLLGAMNGFFAQTLTGFKQVTRRTVITSFISSPLTIVFTIGLVVWGLGLWGYLAAQIAAAAVICALLIASVWSLTPKEAKSFSDPWPPFEPDVISFSTAAFGIGLLEFLLAQSDGITVGFFRNAREVGIYAIAMALVGFVPVVLQSVNQIFSPTIADLHARGEYALLSRLFQTLTKWILGLTLPLAAVMVIFARPMMSIFGSAFQIGWPILIIGTIGQLVNCGAGSVGYLLLMSGQQNRLVRIQIVMAILMVLLNVLFVPRWGINGAAAATAIVTAVSNVWSVFEVRRRLGLFPYNLGYLRLLPPLAGTMIILLVVRAVFPMLRPEWLVIGVSLALGYAAFVGIAVAVGLDADDQLIAHAMRSRIGNLFERTGVSS